MSLVSIPYRQSRIFSQFYHYSTSLFCFNSLQVVQNRNFFKSLPFKLVGFNSLQVVQNRKNPMKAYNTLFLFQFLIGSLESLEGNANSTDAIQFQFLIGSLESGKDVYTSDNMPGFNSLQVVQNQGQRLKQATESLGFNSLQVVQNP